MPFENAHLAQNRLADSTSLSEAEIQDMFRWLPDLDQRYVRILEAQLALLTMQALHQNREAIERFEKSSGRWTRAITALTVVLVLETLTLLWPILERMR